MMLRWTLVRMTPLAASLLLHAVAYGAIAMAVVPRLMPVQEHVLVADLVEPDPAPPAPPPQASEPPRKAPSPKRVIPPKPIPPKPVEMPLPSVTPAPEPRVETPPPPPPPPAPVAQEPPAAPPAPRATAPLDAPPASTGEGLPAMARTEPPAAAPAAPAPAMPAAPAPVVPSGPPAASAPATPGGPSGAAVAAVPHDGVTRTAVPRGGYQVRPSYPANARRLGVQGTTLLSVFVAADGRVADVVVKQSAGHPDLDQAAADAVRRWRFEPARRGNEPVAMWVLLPVEFRLR
jgi:protein TonB